jgi:hypothetical protein
MKFLRRCWPLLFVGAIFLGLALLSPLESQYDPANPYAYEESANQISNWDWTLTAAIAAAIFTGVLAIIAMVQVYDTRKSSERQLRAYLMVEKARIEDVEVGKTPRAVVTLKNFGQTPAYEVQQWANIGYDFFPPKNTFPMEDTDAPCPATQMGPGGTFIARPKINNSPPLNETVIAALKEGTFAIYVIGKVKYRDTFGNPQSTEYVMFAGGPIGIGDEALSPYINGMKST